MSAQISPLPTIRASAQPIAHFLRTGESEHPCLPTCMRRGACQRGVLSLTYRGSVIRRNLWRLSVRRAQKSCSIRRQRNLPLLPSLAASLVVHPGQRVPRRTARARALQQACAVRRDWADCQVRSGTAGACCACTGPFLREGGKSHWFAVDQAPAWHFVLRLIVRAEPKSRSTTRSLLDTLRLMIMELVARSSPASRICRLTICGCARLVSDRMLRRLLRGASSPLCGDFIVSENRSSRIISAGWLVWPRLRLAVSVAWHTVSVSANASTLELGTIPLDTDFSNGRGPIVRIAVRGLDKSFTVEL